MTPPHHLPSVVGVAVLRPHVMRLLFDDGVVRDTVYYSILDSEWQGVKQRLEGFLERGRSPVQSA